MANATWNPADKAANLTLSGGNLVVTSTSSATGGVRTTAGVTTGKFYWEVTLNTIMSSTGVNVGVATAAADMTSISVTEPASGGVTASGFIFVNGSYVAALTALSNGGIICIALDAGANLLWIRSGAAEPWNNNGSANPATGTAGAAIGAGGAALYPYYRSAGTGEVATANFGATAFAGAVPSGFTAGFGVVEPGGAGSNVRVMVMA